MPAKGERSPSSAGSIRSPSFCFFSFFSMAASSRKRRKRVQSPASRTKWRKSRRGSVLTSRPGRSCANTAGMRLQ